MGFRGELTRRAGLDLAYIYEGIQAEDSKRAADWFNGLEDAIDSLENYPGRGATTPENRKLRQLLYGSRPRIYRIIYRVNGRARKVEVLHIRHGARDVFDTGP